MMSPRAWQGAPRRLIGSFVLVLFAPAAAVVWLGARLIEQDRAIAANQLRERRASAADLFVAGLSQALSATERQLGETPASLVIDPDDDAVLVTLKGEAVVAYPADRLPYLPALLSAAPDPEDEFRAAEALEFRDRNYRGAAGAYRRLTRSGTPALRAGALLRLARVLKQSGRADDALRVYADLALLGEARVAGLPADLVARRARVVLLQETGRTETFAKEVRSLQGDLRAGRWPIDGGTFFAYSDQLRRWSGVEPAGRPESLALAAAVDWLWQQRIDMAQSDVSASGRHALEFDGVSVCLLWRAVGDRLVVLAAGPRFQHREWFAGPEAAVDARRLRVSLAGSDGRPALGGFAGPAGAATERREALATRLPWTVFIEAQDSAGDLAEIAGRRRTLLAGFALLVGLVLAGGYFIARAVSREFAVAQLQSDFVSAVSHEFRTPLTSLAQRLFITPQLVSLLVPRTRTLPLWRSSVSAAINSSYRIPWSGQ